MFGSTLLTEEVGEQGPWFRLLWLGRKKPAAKLQTAPSGRFSSSLPEVGSPVNLCRLNRRTFAD
jgi:hypothetical protein